MKKFVKSTMAEPWANFAYDIVKSAGMKHENVKFVSLTWQEGKKSVFMLMHDHGQATGVFGEAGVEWTVYTGAEMDAWAMDDGGY